jgi:4-alpha-glucanotransferase
MNHHGLRRMYVIQYELVSNRRAALPTVPQDSVASLNTHDMFPFAAFWQGLDIKERRQFGLLNRISAQRESKHRQTVKGALLAFLHKKGWLKQPPVDTGAVLNACLSFLSANRARTVLVNLEDLWQETQPQNVPSTRQEYPNWRRKARYRLEEFCQMHQVIDTLKQIDRLRKKDR